ncbi:endonuclease/exonuclease/phosphatase family protein [Pelagimonas varians]|uniref:Endonuclease/Exonuclease/phosphatase family protein n=1 Tax=Pelagimonas varians TaxID=696760 RepID=A0A238KFF4_9RHOB|nr:endonuclease/exonuclease/phosphatase family protein [Pelagimonas varians]PYG29893.1 endonuclease/exonuclease/phosphatase family metal-dependent hydrolase [Pelagimonas varians]SMX40842.1 Endonuclease/Exonuclease/phosphatase family protein [Pelagimonas varians]
MTYLTFCFVLASCASLSPPPQGPLVPDRVADSLRLASHNVHFIRSDRDNGAWSLADWDRRKEALDATFKAMDADIVAFQEMVSMGATEDRSVNLAQEFLQTRNSDYAIAATGDWQVFPTRQPIFYRKDRLTLLDQGWFYFDDPSEIAQETASPAFWIYYCSWAKFSDRQRRNFYVYNLHFHYHDSDKRQTAAHALAQRIAPALERGDPVFAMGDTNALSDGVAVHILRRAGLKISEAVGATFHFNAGLGLYGAIDRIGSAPQIEQIGGPWVVRQKFEGDWPSDHYPIVADFRLP